jgi:t-SNARE complex subunit (syntaxin)
MRVIRLGESDRNRFTVFVSNLNLRRIEISGYRSKPLSMAQQRALAQHAQNKEDMKQIDAGLDALVGITGQTATNATAIGNELTEQIDMMKDTNDHMDRTDANINKATNELRKVQKTGGSTLCSWIIMVLLVIAIIVCAAVPIPKIKK